MIGANLMMPNLNYEKIFRFGKVFTRWNLLRILFLVFQIFLMYYCNPFE